MFSLFNKAKPVTASSEALPAPLYNDAERQQLLGLARHALTQVVTKGVLPELPTGLPPSLLSPRGCFVTLEKMHQLRGCIGHIFPREPLARAVIDNARNAALNDTRFPPVTADELSDIAIEISVLTTPKTLEFDNPDDLVRKLRPQIDGVVLEIGERRSTFLPQVWEKISDPHRFLDHLAAKAGHDPTSWRGPNVSIQIYQTEAFAESL